MLAVKNILGDNHNLWDVNVDQEYHEEMTSSEESSQAPALAATQPLVPERIKEPVFL